MRAVLLVALMLSAIGCGPRGSWLPTRGLPDMGGPLALEYGTLLDLNGCVYLESSMGATRYMVIWPFGFSRAGGHILDGSGHPVATIGGFVILGGGEAVPDDYGVPEQCPYGNAWAAFSVNPELPDGLIETPPPS